MWHQKSIKAKKICGTTSNWRASTMQRKCQTEYKYKAWNRIKNMWPPQRGLNPKYIRNLQNSAAKTKQHIWKISKGPECTFFKRRYTYGEQVNQKCSTFLVTREIKQHHSEIYPHTCQNGYYQRKQVLARMWRKGNTYTLLVGM